jgi:hypothetical protein
MAARRWLRVLCGPLPATVVLLPVLIAGGVGAAFAAGAALLEPGRSAAERWAGIAAPGMFAGWVAAAGTGVAALWVIVLTDAPATLRQTRMRWWLVAGLCLGILAAGRWLWVMGAGGHRYDRLTWGLWLGLLLGPLVLAIYYLALLVRGADAT